MLTIKNLTVPLVPTLCVGMPVVTAPAVTRRDERRGVTVPSFVPLPDGAQSRRSTAGAVQYAFPHGAWERGLIVLSAFIGVHLRLKQS